MTTMSQNYNFNYNIHFKIYQNICIFAEQWRKFTKLGESYDREEFQRQLQYNRYIHMKYFNEKSNRNIIILFLPVGSKIGNKSPELKKILSSIMDVSDIIIISENVLNSHLMRAIDTFKKFRIKTYVHDNFSIIIPESPLCSKHVILTQDEANKVIVNDLYCKFHNLPKIDVDDPQCIWIGAELGDIIKVTSNSDVSGKYIHYRLVVSNKSKNITFKKKKSVVVNTKSKSTKKSTDADDVDYDDDDDDDDDDGTNGVDGADLDVNDDDVDEDGDDEEADDEEAEEEAEEELDEEEIDEEPNKQGKNTKLNKKEKV